MIAPEMPNLIWADTYSGKKDAGYWHDKNDVFNPTKYIRADTVTARLAAAEAMAESLLELLGIRAVWTDPHNDSIAGKARATLDKWRAGK